MNILPTLSPLNVAIIFGIVGVGAGITIVVAHDKMQFLPERIHEFFRDSRMIFFVKVGETYQLNGRWWFKRNIKSVTLKEKLYIMDNDKIVYSTKGNHIWFFDREKAVPIPFGKLNEALKDSTKVFKTSMDTKIFKDYTTGGAQDKFLLLCVAGLVIMLVIVSGYSIYTINNQNTELMKLTLKIAGIIGNSTKTGGGVITP